jgi:hypothetical protein
VQVFEFDVEPYVTVPASPVIGAKIAALLRCSPQVDVGSFQFQYSTNPPAG